MSEPPLLLVVNDDGIESHGLAALAAALRPLGDVHVFAPAEEMSGVSHHLTIWDPVRTRPATLPDGTRVTAVHGTPADCVKVAALAALPRRPDCVLSGVNRGCNVGVNLFYSGTVGAAMEAAILGIPAAAISLDAKLHAEFGPAAAIGARVARCLLTGAVPPGTLLNVNVPARPAAELGPPRLARQSLALWQERYEVEPDPADPEHGRIYRMRGSMDRTRWDPNDDLGALERGDVAVTILRVGFLGPGVDCDPEGIIRALQ